MSRRRVMLFRPSLGDGGADRVTLTLLEQLDRSRYDTTLVLVRREGALIDRIPSDIEVVDLRARRLALSVFSLANQIRSRRPDVVMSTAGGANVVAVAAHWLAHSSARLVLSERNAVRRPGIERRSHIEMPLKRFAYRLADAITAVSDGVGRDLVEILHVPENRVRVVYNPIISRDLAALAAAPLEHPWFGPGQPPVIVAVGRLVAQKDYPTMLRAFHKVAGSTNVRLAILGIGGDRERLEQQAADLGLSDRVAFVGFDPNPYRWMARASLLLQSSLAEGLPGTLIQSMACGTPVVATDCDHGPREVVRDGVDGFLVRVGDADALADRVGRLLSDPGLRARMSSSARAAGTEYQIESSMRRYCAALDGP